jgi:hypothetical protein
MGHALSSFSQHVAKMPRLPARGCFLHVPGEECFKVFADL